MDWYYSLCKEQRNEDPLTKIYWKWCVCNICNNSLSVLLSCPPQWRLFVCMERKPVSLFEVDQSCLPEHSCNQPFFFFLKEITLVECCYSKVKEKQQQGPGGAGFFVWVFFDPPVCVTGSCWGQSCLEGLWGRACRQQITNKRGSLSGHLSERGWDEEENLGGLLLVFWFLGVFLIKVEERFEGGGGERRKYSQDKRASAEGRNGKAKANHIALKWAKTLCNK